MAKVTMYRGKGFTSGEAFIAISGDDFASARVHSDGGGLMQTPETFINMDEWMCGKLYRTPEWFQAQLVPDNVVWEADL